MIRPSRLEVVATAPVTISNHSAVAHGFRSGAQFTHFVRRRGLRHTRIGDTVFVLADDLRREMARLVTDEPSDVGDGTDDPSSDDPSFDDVLHELGLERVPENGPQSAEVT